MDDSKPHNTSQNILLMSLLSVYHDTVHHLIQFPPDVLKEENFD